MSLFSSLRKNKQQSASDDSAFHSRAEEDAGSARSKRKQTRKGGADPADPALPEKKRARRRLIGAVALVLAAVVGLPMLLDSEPKPLAGDIVIQIPSKDKMPAPAPVEPPPPASASPASPAAPAAADRSQDRVKAAPDSASTSHGEKAAPAEPPVHAPAPVPEPARAAVAPHPAPALPESEKADAAAASKAAARAEDAARARALLNGKPDPQDTEKNAGRFVIQVAALATKEKVDELRNKLKNAGIRTYTQKVATASGDRTRIRVGPFASKEAAEKVRARIIKLGLNGVLVPV